MEKKPLKMSFGSFLVLVVAIIILIFAVIMGWSKLNKGPNINNSSRNEYSSNEELAENLIKRIGYSNWGKQNALDELLRVKRFDKNNISNELILKLGFLSINSDEKEVVLNEKQEPILSISKEKMKNSISYLLGNNIQYTDSSFKLNNSRFIFLNPFKDGVVEYKDGVYTTKFFKEISGGPAPYVYQKIDKVDKSNEKIDIYVKIAFVDSTSIAHDDGTYVEYELGEVYYKNYNYETAEFQDKLIEIKENDKLKIEDTEYYKQLNTYVYTFEQDSSNGEYYLSKFMDVSKNY